jgi:hypothetical protein
VWLSIVVVLAVVPVPPVGAQVPGSPSSKDAEAPAKKADDAEKKADAEEPAGKDAPTKKANATAEVFKDPRAEKFLENKFPQLYRACRPTVPREVRAMAAGQSNIDRDMLVQFVEGMAHELTDHTNIKALIEPENIRAGAPPTVAFQVATDNLIDMIQTAKQTNNTAFTTIYNKILVEKLPALLNGHFLTRIEAMIVLAQTGDASPEMIALFTRQLSDPKQTVWVKLWALRGLTNVAPTLSNESSRAMNAAKVVADFLEQEKDLPWPVQYRALEALGSLRQASTARPKGGQPEMASAAIRFLADPEAKPEVRAEAGWALGQMQVSGSIGKYNFPLIAHNIGDVAANLGESINETFPKNPSKAEYLTGLLLKQVYEALEGVPATRGSGLLRGDHPNIGASRNYIKQVSDLIKPIAKTSVELIRAPKGQVAKLQKDLGDKVAALKGFLDKNQPANNWLVPGGQPFPFKGSSAVAGAQEQARLVGARGQ